MEYVSSGRKLLPYGMMNFADIRLDNYYYVDKTSFIPIIEQSDRFFFFIRPRRFGKSLTLNMLQHYYDVRARDKFDAQANRYADTERVKNAIGTTQLHKIVVVYKGMEMRVCEEVNSTA